MHHETIKCDSEEDFCTWPGFGEQAFATYTKEL